MSDSEQLIGVARTMVEFGGETVQLMSQLMNVDTCFDYGLSLTSMAGNLVGSLVSAGKDGLGAAISGAAKDIMAKGGSKWAAQLFVDCKLRIDGVLIKDVRVMRDAFRGKVGIMLKAIEWLIRENLTDFFTALLDLSENVSGLEEVADD